MEINGMGKARLREALDILARANMTAVQKIGIDMLYLSNECHARWNLLNTLTGASRLRAAHKLRRRGSPRTNLSRK